MTAEEALDLRFRRSLPLSLSSAVKSYISTKYDQHPDMFTSDLALIDTLRTDAVNVQEPHPSGITKLCKYASQLQWISGKFPIDMGADFTWYPSLGYNTHKAATQNNLQFERANIIFNLAVLYSQLATSSPRDSGPGLKAACNYFCAAAGTLKYLKEEVLPEVRSSPPEDMDAATLDSLEQLMLAQAQECYWRKAVVDENKDSVIARLAASVSDFYDNAAEMATKSEAVVSEWMHHMNAKHHHFAAAAQYRAACDCLERGKYGEEVARLQDAEDAVSEAMKEKRYINKAVVAALVGMQEKIVDTLKGAEKDNDMIYHQDVPAPRTLPRISRAAMASSKTPKELSQGASMIGETLPYGPPLFSKLVPFAVTVAASIYTDRRDRLINTTIIAELENLTTQLRDLQHSLNLPGSLQALEKPLGLPASIVQHADAIRSQGGLNALSKTCTDIDKIKSTARATYDEAVQLLNLEKAEDDALRLKHGTTLWTRPESSQAAGKLSSQVQEYATIFESAASSDDFVRNRLESNAQLIDLLSGPDHALEDFVPNSAHARLSPRLDATVGALRQVLNSISRLESRRTRKIQALREKLAADDITSSILEEAARLERISASKLETADFEPFFTTRMEMYSGEKDIVEEERAEQQSVALDLRRKNDAFVAERKKEGQAKEREERLQRLEEAWSAAEGVRANLENGREFYNALVKQVLKIAAEARSFVARRREEAARAEGDVANMLQNLRLQKDVSADMPALQPAFSSPPPASQQPADPNLHSPLRAMQRQFTPVKPHLAPQWETERPREEPQWRSSGAEDGGLHSPPLPVQVQQPKPAPVPVPTTGVWGGTSTTAIRFGPPPGGR